MISQPDSAGPGRRQAGFTLIEILVVLAVLGLMVGLVVSRGPPRSAGLELRAATSRVAQSLRAARARAIVTDAPVLFRLDQAGHAYGTEGGRQQPLPAAVAAVLTGVRLNVSSGEAAVIRFSPDGSSSGGRVDLALSGRRMRVAVAWLTGRVDVSDAP